MPSAPSLRRLAIGAALLVALAACGSGSAPSSAPSQTTTASQVPDQSATPDDSPSPSLAGAQGDLTPWVFTDQQPTASDGGAAIAGDPVDGVEAPAPSFDPTTFDTNPPQFGDPCALVNAPDWAAVNDNGSISDPIVLEDGTACGWTNGSDTRRLAISLTEAGFAATGGAAGGEAIDGLGESATWYANWPVSQSSTLVVTINRKDLVLEMSARDPADADWMRSSAINLAQDAINTGGVN